MTSNNEKRSQNTRYLIETHMHTSEISGCSSVSAKEGIQIRKDNGFDAVIITDNFNDYTLDRMGNDWREQVDNWFNGYKAALREGVKIGIDVYLGAEFQFLDDKNDYLLYGISENFLYNLENMFCSNIEKLYKLARKEDILVVQAHPFRTENNPISSEYLDGVEVYNGHQISENNNSAAMDFCIKNDLIMTAGGDFHEPADINYAMSFHKRFTTITEFVKEARKGRVDIVNVAVRQKNQEKI